MSKKHNEIIYTYPQCVCNAYLMAMANKLYTLYVKRIHIETHIPYAHCRHTKFASRTEPTKQEEKFNCKCKRLLI